MLLVEPSAEIIAVTDQAIKLIERAGRTCYKSEDRITSDSAKAFVASLIMRGHESVLEHASMTVKITCDRGVTHEIVRHRVASYSQESTRYCNYGCTNVTFVRPPWLNIDAGEWSEARSTTLDFASPEREWVKCMLAAEQTYKYLLNCNWKPEQARSVMPNSLKTEIVMTANFREWRHFFFLRLSSAAHPQMRQIATMILTEAWKKVDVVFNGFLAAKV